MRCENVVRSMSARVLLALLGMLSVYEACHAERNYYHPLAPPAPPASPQPLIPIPVPGGIPSLKPIQKPAGAIVLDSSLCGQADADAGFQVALNQAAGKALWIPPGCVVNLSQPNGISSNTTLACGMGGGVHNMSPLRCAGAPDVIYGNNDTNVTIEGCTMTGTYDPVNAAADHAWMAANGCPNWIYNGGDVATFNGGSNIIFTDNAVTNLFAQEGLFLGGVNGATISKNAFANNFQNGIQFSSCHNCNVTGNYAVDTNIDIEDAGPHPPGLSTGVWSDNTFVCVNGSGLQHGASPSCGPQGGDCILVAGNACTNGPGQTCYANEYSGIIFENNVFTGPGMNLVNGQNSGIVYSNHTYTNGANFCPLGFQ